MPERFGLPARRWVDPTTKVIEISAHCCFNAGFRRSNSSVHRGHGRLHFSPSTNICGLSPAIEMQISCEKY